MVNLQGFLGQKHLSIRIIGTYARPFLSLTLLGLLICCQQPVNAAACTALPADKGTASTTFTVATAGTYRLWAHTYASPAGAGAFDVMIDSACPVTVDGSQLAASTFSWEGSGDSSGTPVTVNLTRGTHTITLAGQDAKVGVDEILLLSNSTCVPTADGNNCEVAAAASTPPPIHPKLAASQKTHQHKLSKTKLTIYTASTAIIAALMAMLLLRYAGASNVVLRRSSLFKHRSLTQPVESTPSTVVVSDVSEFQPSNPLADRKVKALFVFGFAIVGGFITFISFADTEYNIAINLANAKVSGQTQIVANTSAIGGSMVQFGSGTALGQTAAKPGTSSSVSRASGGTSSGSSSGSGSSGSGSGSGSGGSGSGSGTLMSNVECDYQADTWSGDASSVGYTVNNVSSSNGNPASFSVRLNANGGTTEVVGYPSDQCLLYSALPANLSSAFNVTPPAASNGLDYEFAYDIWLTTASAAQSYDWNNDLELMVWNYVNGQVPAGSIKATLADGSKVWIDGDNSTGIISVVRPSNVTSGSVNISSLVSQLKSLGYVNNAYDGILDVEYGIEAPYGGGQTFTVNSVSLSD